MTVVTMETAVFYDVSSCCLEEVRQHLGGTRSLRLQGCGVSRKQQAECLFQTMRRNIPRDITVSKDKFFAWYVCYIYIYDTFVLRRD
jgi:hypothetical protein